jgi:hypothetical protein
MEKATRAPKEHAITRRHGMPRDDSSELIAGGVVTASISVSVGDDTERTG